MRLPPWARVLLLSLLSTGLLLADDFIQQCFVSANLAELELRYVLVLWVFSIGLWLSGTRWLAALLLTCFALMQLMQLAHVSYFGEPMQASDIRIMIDDWPDVQESGLKEFFDHWHVLLAVLLPYALLIALHTCFSSRLALPRHWLAWVLVLAVVLAKPYRATYRDMDNFMAGPTRSGLHNSLNAFGYFAVNLAWRAPPELPSLAREPYAVEPVPATARHVWVVVADSLRTERLGVFGYARDTTPELSALQRDGHLLVRPGIAGGVTTAVALAHFLNLAGEPGRPDLIREQPYNLYRLARAGGFRNYWLSSQESKLLSYAGSRFIDVSLTREDHPLLFLKRHDHAVVDLLKRQSWAERNFVVINLRTAHLPYEENYDQHYRPMEHWPVRADMPRQERFGNAYDNALRYLDDVLAEIIRDFDKLDGERYLLITGDHGQLLGERGRWGHNDLQPEVVEVPMMLLARQGQASALAALREERWISHQEAGLWLAERMGSRVRIPGTRPGEHVNHGNQLFGDKYIQRVREGKTGLVYTPPELLSHWLESQGAAARNGR